MQSHVSMHVYKNIVPQLERKTKGSMGDSTMKGGRGARTHYSYGRTSIVDEALHMYGRVH